MRYRSYKIVYATSVTCYGNYKTRNVTSVTQKSVTETLKKCYGSYDQWRNVTIRCPPADFFAAPHKFLTVSKKKEKKRSPLFFRFFLYAYCPPGAFCTPNIFFASTKR